MDVTLYNAVSLYIASPTGRGQRGDSTLQSFARKVTNYLKQQIAADEVGFEDLDSEHDGKTRHGIPALFCKDISISTALQSDFIAVSLVLAHEGGHMDPSRSYFDEEL